MLLIKTVDMHLVFSFSTLLDNHSDVL